MNFFLESVQLIMNLGGSVMLPIMITILGLIFGIKFFESHKFRNFWVSSWVLPTELEWRMNFSPYSCSKVTLRCV